MNKEQLELKEDFLSLINHMLVKTLEKLGII
jgi:hypothetical protein